MVFSKLYSAIYADDGFPFDALVKPGGRILSVTDDEQLDDPAGALVIWGGADIHPDLYDHPMHHTTHPGGRRDRVEWSLLQRAKDMGMSIIGVCRGAQMLCAAAGGFLLQDVRNHVGGHFVRTHDDDFFNVNSIHHQMMAGLETVDHELVAWREATARNADGTPVHAGAPYGYMDNKVYAPPEGWQEPEFVFFPKIRGYAIQWHPEGMSANSPATKYVLNYITKKEEEYANGYATKVLQCSC